MTDASSIPIAVVLFQNNDNGRENLMQYACRFLSDAEKIQIEIETLSVIYY